MESIIICFDPKKFGDSADLRKHLEAHKNPYVRDLAKKVKADSCSPQINISGSRFSPLLMLGLEHLSQEDVIAYTGLMTIECYDAPPGHCTIPGCDMVIRVDRDHRVTDRLVLEAVVSFSADTLDALRDAHDAITADCLQREKKWRPEGYKTPFEVFWQHLQETVTQFNESKVGAWWARVVKFWDVHIRTTNYDRYSTK